MNYKTGLEDFIGKIREMGYPVKLDTNGTQPEVLRNLAEKDLIQMVMMNCEQKNNRN